MHMRTVTAGALPLNEGLQLPRVSTGERSRAERG